MLAAKVSKGILSLGTWTVTRVLVSALATPFLSRILGTDGYGQYAYYLAILILAVPLASVGTLQTLSKYISESPDPARRSRIARLGGIVSIAGYAIVGTVVVLALTLSSSPPPWELTLVLLLCIGFDVLWFYARGLLYGLQREELAGIPGAIASVLGSVIGVVLAYLGYGLLGVFTGLMLGNAFMALAALRAGRRLIPRTHAVQTTDPPLRGLLLFSLSTMLFTSFSMFLYKSGIMAVQLISDNRTMTGLFATGLQSAESVWVFIVAVEGVMLQSTSRLWTEGRLVDISAMVSRMLRYIALGTAFVLLYLLVYADELVRLYFGVRFADAAPVLRILVPGVLSYSLARLLGPVLHARGSVLVIALIAGSSALLNVVLCLLFIPKWGVFGAGLATSIAYGIVLAPYALLLRKHGVHVFKGFAAGRQLALVILTGGVLVATSLLPAVPLVRLALGGVAGAAFYVALAFRMHLVRVQELVTVVESLPDPVRRFFRRLIDRFEPLLRAVAGGKEP
ncbi:MAG: polysaccharide biosynthesis C-terminal domain-containing protein [Bacteroidetes bacterium]|nr:polysaccharide biosynthesis C-terminal domain-containing protein [Bacteroidota bacterium]